MTSPDTIAIRAFTEARTSRERGQASKATAPSEWSLVFDCETTVDSAQRLRVGCYQVRKNGHLTEEGLFFDGEALDMDELATLNTYVQAHDLRCLTRAEFVDWVLLRVGYERRGLVIGFNLPFDLSRVAIAHNPARLTMRGGFSFQVSAYARQARVRVKHLHRRASLIAFAHPAAQETARSERRRGFKTPTHRGHFVDVSTLAAALLSEGFTLARLCKRLTVPTQKAETELHGERLTGAYLDYLRTDVQATWECYCALLAQYNSHRLSTPPHRILSEASIGKAYFREMGVAPLLERQPDFPRAVLGKIMGAYYGGRSEVHWRRTIKRVLYCDFKSMYPTVNALMGLWRFVIADRLNVRDTTDEARRLLANAKVEQWQDRQAWPALTMIVRVRPDKDLFPVRAKYGEGFYTIGLNWLSYAGDLWMTLADCVAAKILSGKAPHILEAIGFSPGPPQAGLEPINLLGDDRFQVDPIKDDVFARFVDLRDEAKAVGSGLQQQIKIIANATSYGVFIEIIRDDAPKSEPIILCGPEGGPRETHSKAIENPGSYFHPLLGVLITGAARLMLALAERRALDVGLDWAFCDTDSLALVKPDQMSESDFTEAARSVVDWFVPLNPYRKPGSILKLEDVNFSCDGMAPEPLYCFAISAKRYALFNIDADGAPIIRKASAHGLGHFIPPYTEIDAPRDVPSPAYALSEIGVERWQYDLWFKIVEAALAGTPDRLELDYHPALAAPALSRFGITSPYLERWMRFWNARRDYAERARPFGFMTTFQVRATGALTTATYTGKRGRPRKLHVPKPIAPFTRDPQRAAQRAFDRETGAPVSADTLQSYAQALAQYHLHPEDKFQIGDYLDRGPTQRRCVKARRIVLIGKEANKWEADAILLGDDTAIYGEGLADCPGG